MGGQGWWIEWVEAGRHYRRPIDGPLTLGRSQACDVVVSDDYVSRRHCVVTAEARGVTVVAHEEALNPVLVDGRGTRSVTVGDGGVFTIGETDFRVRARSEAEEETQRLPTRPTRPKLVLRASTRELVDGEGTLLAQFSQLEFLAFQVLASKYPDAVSHDQLGRAVWAGMGFDQYQLHRLLQRIRQRLGDAAPLLENVRGSGYRVRSAIDVR